MARSKSGKSIKDSKSNKKPKLSLLEKRKLKEEKRRNKQ